MPNPSVAFSQMNALSPYPLWIFFLVAGICVVLIGIDKTGFGGGIGTLATPLLSLVTSPLVAVGLLLPILCACDLVALWHYRGECDRRNLKLMLPGALAGVALGALSIWLLKDQKALAERVLRMSIGAISILFVAWQVGRGWLLRHLPPSRPRAGLGTLAGAAAGFTSTLAHAGGPPAVMYLLPQGLNQRLFVGTTVWFFAALNYAKLVPYAGLGLLKGGNLAATLALLPLVPVGALLGVALNRWMQPKLFVRVVMVVLLLTGIQLLTGMTLADVARAVGR